MKSHMFDFKNFSKNLKALFFTKINNNVTGVAPQNLSVQKTQLYFNFLQKDFSKTSIFEKTPKLTSPAIGIDFPSMKGEWISQNL